MKMKDKKQTGFTIVELLVAMAVFQVILISTLIAYMQISRFYQKSINTARLHQISTDTVNEIARSIQNTGGLVASDLFNDVNVSGGDQNRRDSQSVIIPATTIVYNGIPYRVVCVDTTRYLFNTDIVETGEDAGAAGFAAPSVQHAFMSDTLPSASACGAPFPQNGKYRIILGKNMRVYSFGVAASGSSLYNIWINLAFTSDPADIDTSAFVLNAGVPTAGSYIACKGGAGSQYCAVANTSTTVVRRIGL